MSTMINGRTVQDRIEALEPGDSFYWDGAWFFGSDTWLNTRRFIRNTSRYTYKTHTFNCAGVTKQGVCWIAVVQRDHLSKLIQELGIRL